MANINKCQRICYRCGEWDVSGCKRSIDHILAVGGSLLPKEDEANGLWGYINGKGEWVIDPKFKVVNTFSCNGLAVVRDPNSGLMGYINEKGDWAIAPRYEYAGRFSKTGLAQAWDSEKKLWGYINEMGEWHIEPKYKKSSSMFAKNGLAFVEDTETQLFGCINDKGNWAIKPLFTSWRLFSANGLAGVQDKTTGLWGYIDNKGNWAINPRFINVSFFSEKGIAAVRDSESGLWGWINAKGMWVENPKYTDEDYYAYCAEETAAEEFGSSETNLNPRHTFDNFVVDENNRFAAGIAQTVAQAPGNSFSPLFIYGEYGVGKTHLLHAIGLYIMEHFPELRVLYVSAETFTEDFISAFFNKGIIKENKMKAFRGMYQNADVLLINDIQFIGNKGKTVEEVINTFEALYNSGKQMVFASDRQPKDLFGIDERLRRRLGMGLIVDLKKPSYETMVAILKNEATLDSVQENDGLSEAISFMAEHINNNVLDLKSAFYRVVFYSKLTDKPVTKALAEEVLKDVMNMT